MSDLTKNGLFEYALYFRLRFRGPQSNKLYDFVQSSPPQHEDKPDFKNNTWDLLHDMLKNLTNSKELPTEAPHKELANFLRGIAMKGSNKSGKYYNNVFISP